MKKKLHVYVHCYKMCISFEWDKITQPPFPEKNAYNRYLIKSSKYLFEENLFLLARSQLVKPKMKTDSLMHVFSPICNRLISRKMQIQIIFVNYTVKKKLKTFSSPIKNMTNVSIDENTGPQSIIVNSSRVWMPQGTVLNWC